MIIANRHSSIAYSADPIAHSVRLSIAPSARPVNRTQVATMTVGGLDLARMYPNLFADAPLPSTVTVRTLLSSFAGSFASFLQHERIR